MKLHAQLKASSELIGVTENARNHISLACHHSESVAEKYYGSLHIAFSTSNDKYAEVRMRKS